MSERPLGTMITYGYPGIELEDELDLAIRIGTSVLEILPEWSGLPDPALVRRVAADRGLAIHSAHGCWGRRTICAASRSGSLDPLTQHESIDGRRGAWIGWRSRGAGTWLSIRGACRSRRNARSGVSRSRAALGTGRARQGQRFGGLC